jgi:hypothetical protein
LSRAKSGSKDFDSALKALSTLEQSKPFTEKVLKKAGPDGIVGGFWGFLNLYSREGTRQILLRHDDILSEYNRVGKIIETISK